MTSQFASPSSEGDFAVVSAAAGAYALRLKKEFVATSLCAESCEEYGQLRLVNVQERETFRLAPLKGRLLVRVFARARTPSPPHPR